MACRLFQDVLVRGVEDRDLNVDFGDLHISHHTISQQVQARHVLLMFLGIFVRGCRHCEGIRKDAREQRFVIGNGFFLCGGIINLAGSFLFRYGCVIAGNQL